MLKRISKKKLIDINLIAHPYVEATTSEPTNAVALWGLGGLKGGKARAEKLLSKCHVFS